LRHTIILRDQQPEKWAAFFTDRDLTPMQVMQENMAWFHAQASLILATILAMPLNTETVQQDQLDALRDLAGVIKLRELAQQCARDLARHVHPKAPPISARDAAKTGKEPLQVERIPTPKAVVDAFQRVIDGLPPEPRKRL
jgi:hypothetical protein